VKTDMAVSERSGATANLAMDNRDTCDYYLRNTIISTGNFTRR